MFLDAGVLKQLYGRSSSSLDFSAVNAVYDEAPHLYPLLCCYPQFDIPFWNQVAKPIRGPILDLGCGTGRVTVPLAQNGIQVVGVDRSIGMLHLAAKNISDAGATATFIKEDFRALQLSITFDLAIAPANVINHCFTTTDIDLFLSSVRRSLNRSAKFVIGARNQLLGQAGTQPVAMHTPAQLASGYRLEWTALPYDHKTQLSLAIFSEITSAGTTEYFLAHRIYYPDEAATLLSRHGFVVDNVLGDFDGNPFNASSRHMIISCTAI
ncbi:hypothetical protein IE4803_CH03404 [Rhizobium etli bv. phaseoli str. IE4803]|nr:hypothetical protein IE4803_CH03404 [Rhizobium etli bv. phaseoli str. IE4803]